MPDLKKAELIDGVAYIPSGIGRIDPAAPLAHLIGWLGYYSAYTDGVDGADNATLILDEEIDWFVLRDDRYERLSLEGGFLRSVVFPGLWPDPAAMIRDDMQRVHQVVQEGVASPEHAAFVDRLRATRL